MASKRILNLFPGNACQIKVLPNHPTKLYYNKYRSNTVIVYINDGVIILIHYFNAIFGKGHGCYEFVIIKIILGAVKDYPSTWDFILFNNNSKWIIRYFNLCLSTFPIAVKIVESIVIMGNINFFSSLRVMKIYVAWFLCIGFFGSNYKCKTLITRNLIVYIMGGFKKWKSPIK